MPRTEIVIIPTNDKQANIDAIDDCLSGEGITFEYQRDENKFYIDEDSTRYEVRQIGAFLAKAGCQFKLDREEASPEDRTQDWYGRSADTEEWHG